MLPRGGVTLRYLFVDMNDLEILRIEVTQSSCHN